MGEQKTSYGLLIRPKGLTEAVTPYDWFKKMRSETPVAFDAERNCWDVFSYEEVQTVLSAYKSFSSQRNGLMPTLLDLDPPTHRRYRNIVSEAFTPKAVQDLAPQISKITQELLETVKGKQEIDIVADIAYPLPVIVIAYMLGVPNEDRETFKRWSNLLVAGSQSQSPEEMMKLVNEQRKAVAELCTYFHTIVEHRRKQPKNDLVSTLIAAQVNGEQLSIEDLLSFCLLLLVAGNETTTNLITNAMLTFFEHPDILKQLYKDPSLIPAAIEEVLRYRAPVHSMNRFVVEDIELRGMKLKKGQEVMAWIGSANRDETVFTDPDLFNLSRSSNPYLSFGSGVHFCLGSQLAKLEANISIAEILKTLPLMKLDNRKELGLISSTFVHGYRELPVIVG